MEANELRISNLVLHEGEILTIKSISKSVVSFDGRNYWTLLKDCKPIPLTEDWLTKFGFKHTEDYFQKKSIGKNITLEFAILHKRTILFDNKKKLFVELKFCEYVHQAQNLYFALTGSELTLKN